MTKESYDTEITVRRETAISQILAGNSDQGVRNLMLMVKTMEERDNSNE
jgi:hypothetical protein